MSWDTAFTAGSKTEASHNMETLTMTWYVPIQVELEIFRLLGQGNYY